MGQRKQPDARVSERARAKSPHRTDSARALGASSPRGRGRTVADGGRDRRTGWRSRRLGQTPRNVPPSQDPPLEWWETFDWDLDSFCDCDSRVCERCTAQDRWWAELVPGLAFEDAHGVVHRTSDHDYGALCGNTFYAERATSTDDVRRIAGKALGKGVTCFECIREGGLDGE